MLFLAGAGIHTALPASGEGLRNLYAELNPPPVLGVEIREVRPTAAVIAWPAALSPAERFDVQVRRFSSDADGELTMDWAMFAGAKVKREGTLWRVELPSLLPEQPYWFRVLPQVAPGAPVEPLFAVRFQTPPKTPIFTGQRLLMGGLGAALVVLLWLRWQGGRGAP